MRKLLNIPDNVLDDITAIGKEQGRTANAQIVYACQENLARHDVHTPESRKARLQMMMAFDEWLIEQKLSVSDEGKEVEVS